MSPLISALLKRFLRTVIFTVVAMVIAFLTAGLQNYIPANEVQKMIWELALLPLVNGIIAALDKYNRWQP